MTKLPMTNGGNGAHCTEAPYSCVPNLDIPKVRRWQWLLPFLRDQQDILETSPPYGPNFGSPAFGVSSFSLFSSLSPNLPGLAVSFSTSSPR